MSNEQKPYYVLQSLERVFSIFELFIQERKPLGVTEIAEKTKINKSVVHRMVATMETFQILEQLPDTAKYQVGPKAFEFGAVYMNNNLIIQGKQFLPDLAQKIGELAHAHLAILNQGSVFYLVNQESLQSIRMYAPVGIRNPISTTALGKVLTAWLEESEVRELLQRSGMPALTPNSIQSIDAFLEQLERVRELGYAVDDEEMAIGHRCIAVPLRDYTGKVAAAISLGGTVRSITKDNMEEIAYIVKSYGTIISEKLGYVHKNIY